MRVRNLHPLITTIKEKCRACYTCVRECPVKAIRISSGQAEVLVERCIGCGNCFRVCSQSAKQVHGSIHEVRALLETGRPVSAMLAPSFPAAFGDIDHRRLVGMVRALGFSTVHEVGFGADLVADRYAKLMADHPRRRYIATTCPALVGFVEYFHHTLVDRLAPVVSPMLAEARVLRRIYGSERQLVFIGPCIAKKTESDPDRPDEIDGVLTFIELQEMLAEAGVHPEAVPESEFDEPRAHLGALFPISRGILQAAGISEDLMAGEVVAADGRANFVEAVKELESGALDARMLEVLCCSGCIMGPGIQNDLPLFRRRSLVSRYVRTRSAAMDHQKARKWAAQFADLDLSRRFLPRENPMGLPGEDEVVAMLHRMGKFLPTDELNCGACGYETCRDHAEAIVMGLAESEMCLPYTIEQLRKTLAELDHSRRELAGVQAALIQSEKLASMGQLSAAIAHEINNPLGVVLMYTHMLHDECPADSEMREDLKTIAEQTDRCKKIVAGLLNFARQNKVMHQPVDINDLVSSCLKTMPPPEGISVSFMPGMDDPVAEIDADQITQVLVNLISNAYEAMSAAKGNQLRIATSGTADTISFTISDTGIGILPENHARIFDPFFTTKQVGKGTGLGLAVSYGIIKMHRGDIQMTSNADTAAGPTGTTFTITLPRLAGRE
jgi:signal transduction histidine kinase/iron only hydrogenase large subunit-like protein